METGDCLGLTEHGAHEIRWSYSALRHADLGSFALQPGVELLDHLLCPSGVDLTRRVLALAKHHVAPLIDQVIHFGVVGYFLRQLGRNKSQTLGIADGYVTWHHGCISDANGDVNSGQHDVLEGGGIHAARVDFEARNFLNTGDIPHRSVDNQSVVTLGVDSSREIVTDDRAVSDFSEQIHDQNVARCQDVYDPGVFISNAIFFLAVLANYRIQVGPLRHKNRGDDADYESLSGVNHLPATFELAAVAGILQDVPRLVRGDVFQASQHRIRNLRATVRKKVALPFRREFNALALSEEVELSMRRRRQQQHQPTHQSGSKRNSDHRTPRRVGGLKTSCIATAKISHSDRRGNRSPAGGSALRQEVFLARPARSKQ